MKKWFGLWIVILLVLIVVYHEEPQRLDILDEKKELYGMEIQAPYEGERIFVNKVDEEGHREYIYHYSYNQGKSLLNRMIKGNDAVVEIDMEQQGFEKMNDALKAEAESKYDFFADEMKSLYSLPEGENIHDLFDENLPKASNADYMYYTEKANGDFYLALFYEETGDLFTYEWLN